MHQALGNIPAQDFIPSLSSFLPLLILVVLLLLPTACTTTPPKTPPQSRAGAEPTPPLKPGDIVDSRTGRPLSFDFLVKELSQARVIYVGEVHTNMEDHRIQLQILQGLHAQGSSPALAMEMFPREAQPILDRYSAGKLSEEAFLKKVDWNKVWGYPFQLYRPILSWAHERALRLIGLNAPFPVVQKIARGGLASLTPGDRRRIASEFHRDDASHRAAIQEEYDGHMKGSIKNFDAFYEAQLAWEETMAETLARALLSLPVEQRIVVLIGNGHIMGGRGVPQFAALRVAHRFATVATLPEDKASQGIAAGVADFVWITSKEPLPHRGRLGLMLRPVSSGKGLEILAVVPDSPADKAGMKKGDIVSSIDGIPVKDMDELHKAVAQGERSHEFTLQRGGGEEKVKVTLPEP